MAAENGEAKGGTKVLTWVLATAAAALLGGVYYFHVRAETARKELETSIERYREMQDMKKTIVHVRKKNPAGLQKVDAVDPLQFLTAKSRQALIPSNLFNVSRGAPQTVGPWSETPYTLTMRATKDTPLPRNAIVDFLRLVEDERPSMRSKNMNLAFQGDDFATVTLTLSSFQRK